MISQAAGDKAVAVLMSGGVDSSVAAFLLKQAGCNPVGVTLLMGSESGVAPSEDAARVCSKLRIPHQTLDVRDAFASQVLQPFKNAYREALTPNPCVLCNVRIKFGMVWEMIRHQLGIERIATGHYARIVPSDTGCLLARAACSAKDQSYFLYRLPKSSPETILFPLGDMHSKDDVRALARTENLPVAEKPESMDLCFLAKGDYRSLFADEISSDKGQMLDANGNVIAEHQGIHNYTVGQRRGLGFAAGQPLYVTRINPVDNTITVGTLDEVTTTTVCAEDINVLLNEDIHPGARLRGKIRSRGEPLPCTVSRCSEDNLEVQFDNPQFAPTPGQHLVLYDDQDHVVAGGMISR